MHKREQQQVSSPIFWKQVSVIELYHNMSAWERWVSIGWSIIASTIFFKRSGNITQNVVTKRVTIVGHVILEPKRKKAKFYCMLAAYTSTKSNAANRSLMNLRIKAVYLLSLGCLLRYSNNQYLRLLLWSLLATLTCIFTRNAIPSKSPAVNGSGSPFRNALTWQIKGKKEVKAYNWKRKQINEIISCHAKFDEMNKCQDI